MQVKTLLKSGHTQTHRLQLLYSPAIEDARGVKFSKANSTSFESSSLKLTTVPNKQTAALTNNSPVVLGCGLIKGSAGDLQLLVGFL